ncbi:MAG: bifunctional phosphoglucose/phosphomannose isomerase [Anaerolineae bacterium]|nr:bifunctional phosphoglucose/phosphomannose isomerase [Anaerolineae bacterium]
MDPLDDLAYLGRLDTGQMLDRIQEFPEQCAAAWDSAVHFAWPGAPEGLQHIVIAGMGGSAIAGELLAHLVAETCAVPIILHRDYGVPAFVGPRSLVIASSYSGNTEETLSAAREALGRGATVVGLSTGGELARLAAEAGFGHYVIRYQSKPRAALAHSFFPLLNLLQRLGLLPEQEAAVQDAVATLKGLRASIGAQVSARTNLAKQLAHSLEGRLVIIYGAEFLAPVAHRWKTQLNENTKAWAFYEVLPEMNHNAVLGYDQPDETTSSAFVVLLDSRLYLGRNRRRVDVTREVLTRAGVDHQAIEPHGESRLAQMLSAVHLGDYLSFYLAALYGTDPTPMGAIDLLKERLQESATRH